MIDNFQLKQQLGALVDTALVTSSKADQLREDFAHLRDQFVNLTAMFNSLTHTNAMQVAYFNELIPGFSDALKAKMELDKHTCSPPETTYQP